MMPVARAAALAALSTFRGLVKIDLVGMAADVDVGDRAIGNDVRRYATFGDDALEAGFGTHGSAHGLDVVEQVDNGFKSVTSGPSDIWRAEC